MFYSWVLFCLGCLFLILRGAVSWVDLFKLAFFLCFKSCNCSSFFSGLVWIPTGGQRGFQSQRRRHLKRGCCFSCYFPLFFLPAKSKTIWEEELYWVQANGVRVGCKDGVYWIRGGLGGQNIARTKCGIGCGVGSDFFFLFIFIPIFSPSKSASLGSWTGLNGGVFPVRMDTLQYPQHSCIHKCYLSPAKHKKKSVGIKRMG